MTLKDGSVYFTSTCGDIEHIIGITDAISIGNVVGLYEV
jgi:hypothetical protein